MEKHGIRKIDLVVCDLGIGRRFWFSLVFQVVSPLQVVNLYPFQEAVRTWLFWPNRLGLIWSYWRWPKVATSLETQTGVNLQCIRSFGNSPCRRPVLRILTLVDQQWFGHLPRTTQLCQGLILRLSKNKCFSFPWQLVTFKEIPRS